MGEANKANASRQAMLPHSLRAHPGWLTGSPLTSSTRKVRCTVFIIVSRGREREGCADMSCPCRVVSCVMSRDPVSQPPPHGDHAVLPPPWVSHEVHGLIGYSELATCILPR